MSDFNKRFVRVEWLAFQKAVDLIREAGFDDSYFVGLSRLIGDEGIAVWRSQAGRELHDDTGQFVKHEELAAEDLGLEDEIGELVQRSEDSGRHGEQYFLKRTYAFEIFQQGARFSYVCLWVSFAKHTEKDDWEVVHECLTDQRRSGKARRVIIRTKDFTQAQPV